MIKRTTKTLIIILSLATALLIACRDIHAVKAVAPDGPYPVGVRILHMELRGREAPVMVWYPARSQPGAEPYLYNTEIPGLAVFDAPAEKKDAPYPLIMFSHGNWGCGCQSVFYTENLASFGYVVVAPDHDDSLMCQIEGKPEITLVPAARRFIKSGGNISKTLDALFGKDSDEKEFDFSYRPLEARAVIDQALIWNQDPASFLYKLIESDKIGVSGHSLGGFTSLLLGGVPIRCQGEKPDAEDCDLDIGDLRERFNPCCMDSIHQMEDPFQLQDKRVKAILPLGPAVFVPDIERAAAELNIPFMIITGDHTWMEVPWEPIWTLYTNARSPKYVIRLKETAHMAIADSNRSTIAARVLFPGFRSHFEDKAQAYKDYSVAFFNLYLKGDSSRVAILKEPTSQFVELYFEEP